MILKFKVASKINSAIYEEMNVEPEYFMPHIHLIISNTLSSTRWFQSLDSSIIEQNLITWVQKEQGIK